MNWIDIKISAPSFGQVCDIKTDKERIIEGRYNYWGCFDIEDQEGESTEIGSVSNGEDNELVTHWKFKE